MSLNKQQKDAVEKINGPVLIIAGPGTGKTFTLVERVKHMVGNLGIDPSQILISTFTNRASFELVDRLSLEFERNNINKDINEMMVGNFHSICRDIINDHLQATYLTKGYMQIDDVTQNYLVQRYLPVFMKIPNASQVIGNVDYAVRNIVALVNGIREEGVLERKSADGLKQAALEVLSTYENLLVKYNMIDFSGILLTCYKLLEENADIRRQYQEKINYIMIDEYQDTNQIQEKIIACLLNENQNLCVVGDDDQSLYRFRGASVRNILEFRKRYPQAVLINLQQNYRSQDSIIRFYSSYLKDLIDNNPELRAYRHSKLLYSDKEHTQARVVKDIYSDEETWIENTSKLIEDLVKTGRVNAYNKIALLVSSVNEKRIRKLITRIKSKSIGVYLPKTTTLISRQEVERLIGATLLIFKPMIDKHVKYKNPDVQAWLDRLGDDIYKQVMKNPDLEDFIKRMSDFVSSNDFSLTVKDIFYRLFAYQPFATYMDDRSKAKNLSRILEIVETFNLVNRLYYIDQNNIEKFVNLFFYDFLAFIKNQKIAEFEEETQIPDPNSISILTIHASKGMEYPVVIMASLWDKPFRSYKTKIAELVDKFSKDQEVTFEPEDQIQNLDFARKYYTGFSRAKDLLVLSGFTGKDGLSYIFDDLANGLENLNLNKLDLEKGPYKESIVKNSYSFTRDILPYRESPINYLYTRKLKFEMPKTKSLYYGSLVHESIEAINKMIIIGKDIGQMDLDEFVRDLARQKYLQGAVSLKEEDVLKAVEEVKIYLNHIDNFGTLLNSELEIAYSTDKYQIKGNVDLVYEKKGKIHIVDFKTGTPPNKADKTDTVRDYLYQINLYAYLYKKTKGKDVASISLYFTDKDAAPKLYTYPVNEEVNKKTLQMVDDVIKEIESGNFEFNKDELVDNLLKFYLNTKQA